MFIVTENTNVLSTSDFAVTLPGTDQTGFSQGGEGGYDTDVFHRRISAPAHCSEIS